MIGESAMNAKTKIIVLHMKELIYTAIFTLLTLLLIILAVIMFLPGKKSSSTNTKKNYVPGVYTASVTLNNTDLEVEVAVDESRINSIRFTNLNESVTTMFPLIQPAIEDIAEQIYEKQSLEDISLSEDTPYTSKVILDTINQAIKKAAVK